tara:strand:- start:720 stop:1655 length:936 start_codon:yes stop_codon:yes gene_type:complete
MAFFDQKEEVLEIELTPYGRYLLSLGEMRPAFYAFFDDDIIYDAECMGYAEDQNETEQRIKETPRTRCQSVFRDIEDDAKAYHTTERANEGQKKALQNYFEREYALTSELGIADYYSNNAPSWDVDLLKGNIKNSTLNYTGSGPRYRIPQINLSASSYDRIVGSLSPTLGPEVPFDEDLRTVIEFETDFVEIRQDFILLEINENNTVFQKENFEIELFEVRDQKEGESRTSDLLVPLKFTGPNKDRTEYVNYYFNLELDMEIEEEMLCKYKGVDSTKGLFIQRSLECTPDVPSVSTDQYSTRVTDVGEVCD